MPAKILFSMSQTSDPRVVISPAVALDIGLIEGQGWAMIELNSAWGAGLYGCDASAVLPVLLRTALDSGRPPLGVSVPAPPAAAAHVRSFPEQVRASDLEAGQRKTRGVDDQRAG